MNKTLLRLNQDVKRALSAIISEMSDRRVSGLVSVSKCDLTPDMTLCRVYLSYIDGKYGLHAEKTNINKSKQSAAVECLEGAAGFLRRELASRVKLRKIPELRFISDDGNSDLDDINRLIEEERNRISKAESEQTDVAVLPTKGEAVTFDEAVEILKEADDILILSHASPDGDTLGSAFALRLALRTLGKKVRFFVNDEYSSLMSFLNGSTDNISELSDVSSAFIVTVDVADKKLLGETISEDGTENVTLRHCFDNVDLAIDHHFNSNTLYAKKTLLENYAACSEIIYKVIIALGIEITSEMAVALYTGIATDTGCFRFSNVTAQTHFIASKLFEVGFDAETINYKLFELKTKKRLELERYVLDNLSYIGDGVCAYIALPYEEYVKYDSEEINGAASIPRRIDGVKVGLFLKEKKLENWKISVRTSAGFDAAEIAKKFGGGGHERASGCKIDAPLEEVKKSLFRYIEEVIMQKRNIEE